MIRKTIARRVIGVLALAGATAFPPLAWAQAGHGGHHGGAAAQPGPEKGPAGKAPAAGTSGGGHDPMPGHGHGHGHGGHAMPVGPVTGSWAYTGRDNPQPHRENRWEMVPVPGYGHMFIAAGHLPEPLRCAALDNPGIMVDRATRKACGLPESPAAKADRPAAPAGAGHAALASGSGHRH